MKKELYRRFSEKIYTFCIRIKHLLYKKEKFLKNNKIEDLLEKYKNNERIVVLCSGPTAKKIIPNINNLYIVTNTGNRIIEGYSHIYFLQDTYYLKQNLCRCKKKNNQDLVICFPSGKINDRKEKYFEKYYHLLNFNLFLCVESSPIKHSYQNIEKLKKFYHKRNLNLTFPNSGIFLLLLGYYLSIELNKPLEVYGLDLGIGGEIHYDNSNANAGVITKKFVKKIVKNYLDYMYNNHPDIKNYSNFYGNMTGFKEE